MYENAIVVCQITVYELRSRIMFSSDKEGSVALLRSRPRNPDGNVNEGIVTLVLRIADRELGDASARN